MTDRDITTLFDKCKNDSTFGREFDASQACKMVADRLGYEFDEEPAKYTVRDYVEVYFYQISHNLLKPVSAALAIFVFAITGWLSVANASVDALPGDKLYPVKLSMEKAQLALTVNDEQRSALRVEFASRRLEEMVQVASLSEQTSVETVQLAADRFKDEVTSIKEDLQEDLDASQAVAVGRKVDSYSTTVASTSSDIPEEVLSEVEEVLEETKDQVVEVIITAHETDQNEESAQELDTELEKEIVSVQEMYGEDAAEAIATAEALRAEGLYRRAFQVLKDFLFEQED